MGFQSLSTKKRGCGACLGEIHTTQAPRGVKKGSKEKKTEGEKEMEKKNISPLCVEKHQTELYSGGGRNWEMIRGEGADPS